MYRFSGPSYSPLPLLGYNLYQPPPPPPPPLLDFPTVQSKAQAQFASAQEALKMESAERRRLEKQTLTLGQEKKHLEAQCSKLNRDLVLKDSIWEALKHSKEQKSRHLQDELDKKKGQNKDLLKEVKMYKEKFERTQNENDVLKKFKELKKSDDLCIKHSYQISELQRSIKKLRDENEVLEASVKDLDASKSSVESLQAELQQCNQEMANIEGENRELQLANERNSREFELKFNQMESEKEANASSLAKLNETMAEVKRDYHSLINDFSLQISKANEKNNKLEEENEILKANHKDVNLKEKYDLNLCKRELKDAKSTLKDLQAELDISNADLQKCRKELGKRKTDEKLISELRKEKKKLNSESEMLKTVAEDQSQSLKAELETAKTTNERLSGMNMELQKEAERLWKKVYKGSNGGQGSSKIKKEDDNSGPTPPKKKKAKDLK